MNKTIFTFTLATNLIMCGLVWASGVTINWYAPMLAVAFSAFIGYIMRPTYTTKE